MLARSKLNIIESSTEALISIAISEALVNNEISHEDFIIIIHEEKV